MGRREGGEGGEEGGVDLEDDPLVVCYLHSIDLQLSCYSRSAYCR